MQIHEDRYKLLDLKPSLHWYSSHFHTFDVWNTYDACLTMDGGFGGNMGNFTCKLCHASFYFLLSFSVFLPVAIAVDRSYAVTRPFDRTSISRHIKNVILTLWIFSLILSALVFANGRLKTNKKSYLCHTRSPLEYSNGKELNVAFGIFIHKNMYQTMVTSGTWRRSQSKPTSAFSSQIKFPLADQGDKRSSKFFGF